jgi:hypothetical protein
MLANIVLGWALSSLWVDEWHGLDKNLEKKAFWEIQ